MRNDTKKIFSIGFLIIIATLVIITLDTQPLNSYELIEKYESGDSVNGEMAEVVVMEKGTNPIVGEYLWEDRMDVAYVTFNRVNVDDVGIGDTVVFEVYDIYETYGIWTIEISSVEEVR